MNTATTDPMAPEEIQVEGDSQAVALSPEQEARLAAYLAKPRELPKSGIDPLTGRALPTSSEEAIENWARFLEDTAEINANDDDPPGWWGRFVREMNEDRALEGRGPAFPPGAEFE